MGYDPDIHHRRSIRLKGYDYMQSGAYFLTICTHQRECLFGTVVDGNMQLNAAGEMVQSVWNDLPHRYPNVQLDELMVMPNHIHAIIALVGAPLVGAQFLNSQFVNNSTPNSQETGHPQGAPLPDIIGGFKSITTTQYIAGVKQRHWPSFKGKLWQRNYYEHIIRNENDLNRIREYILNNPMQWLLDTENPENLNVSPKKPKGLTEYQSSMSTGTTPILKPDDNSEFNPIGLPLRGFMEQSQTEGLSR